MHKNSYKPYKLKSIHAMSGMPLRNPPFCLPPKAACRANLSFFISGGNHFILSSHGVAVHYQGALSLGLYYREFQTRSLKQLVTKVRNGGQAILAARAEGRAEGGSHWLELYERLQTEGMQGLRDHYETHSLKEVDSHFILDQFNGRPGK